MFKREYRLFQGGNKQAKKQISKPNTCPIENTGFKSKPVMDNFVDHCNSIKKKN